MKNIFLIVLFTLVFTALSFSQTDSIMFLKETDFSLYKMQKVKYQNTGEIKTEKQLFDVEDVNVLTFLSSDSLTLINETANPVHTELANINEIRKYKYHFSPVLGTVIGAVVGGLVGGCYGFVAPGENTTAGDAGAIIGALIGATGGSIISLVITNSINHTTLDLSSVPDKNKKARLIKFLRDK